MILEESTEAQLEKSCRVLVHSDLLDMAVAMEQELVLLRKLQDSWQRRKAWVETLAWQLVETSSRRGC